MDKFFGLSKNQTTVKTEMTAGLTTFLATMYIIVVNPAILSASGMPFSGVVTATILVSAFSSIAMGIYANNPIVLAPGMGLNVFFTYSIVIGMGVSWETALGSVFWTGIIFLFLSALNIRTWIVQAIPPQLRFAIAAGIGLFIAIIGFVNARFIISDPATLISFGGLNVLTITFMIGLLLTSFLVIRRVRGALILGILFTTLLSIPIGRLWGDASAINQGIPTLVTWQGLFDLPDFSVFFKLDLVDWPTMFALLFTDMFDSIATLIGVAEAAGLTDEKGEPRNVKASLVVDGLSTTLSGLFGSSPGTAYIESAAGTEEGGRTGLTSITAGLLFLPFMFFSPLLSIVPAIATAPILILVGVFMMAPITKINWRQFDDAIPAFIGMILIPFTYSITQGIIWGFISWTILKLLVGKKDEITPTLIVIDILAICAIEPRLVPKIFQTLVGMLFS